IVGNRLGFSHCNDFSSRAIDDTIGRAIAFARLTTPDETNVLPSEEGMADVPGLYDPSIAEVPMEQKISMAREIERVALSDPRVSKSSGSGYGEGESEIFIANSKGFAKSYKSSACSISVSVVAEKGEQKNTGSESCSRRFFADLLPLTEVAAIASRDAYELLDPVMIKTQRAAVIFDPDVAGSLFGGVIQALNGERVNQGASFLGNSLGQRFASDLLTIYDDGTVERGMASKPFDGEGVPTAKRVLVEKGIARSFIYNSSAARRAGTSSTGNASRGGFTSLPGIGTHNIILAPGNYSRNEIIASTGKGLLLKGVTGYGIDPVTGNFSGGATGFWIENGEIIHPVKGLTIAGSAAEILNGIDMMGNDIDKNRTFASPTFRVREMQIGGI
ncbi:MAG: TldD/PmbA family protein, partial [Bacteroidales bacterium]|nr:TldD/PmbA family protein [Bacteroidales bacterium]